MALTKKEFRESVHKSVKDMRNKIIKEIADGLFDKIKEDDKG